MEQNPGWSDTQKILALAVTFAFISIIVAWMFYPPKGDPGAIAVLNTLVGSLGTGFGMILTYFFGSSKNSSAKDDTIATMVKTAGAAGTGNGVTTNVEEMTVQSEQTNVNTEKKDA